MLSPVVKLIGANVAVFIITNLVLFLFQFKVDIFTLYLGLPSYVGDFIYKPWTIITYAFLHGGIRHIFFNMLVLYFSGEMFLNYFDGKRFFTVYFLGAIAGGLFFLISYNLFPVFNGVQVPLIGASAAVMAILIFMCAYTPYQEVRLFFILRLKLWHVGLIFVIMDLVQIPLENYGGHISHLGGALLGFLYAHQLKQGRDIGAWFSKLMDGVANVFTGLTTKSSNTKFKKVYKTSKKSQHKSGSVFDNDKNLQQKKIDAILDKISKSGYDSLTKDEKDFLFRAGKN